MIKKILQAILSIFKALVEEKKKEAIEAEKVKESVKSDISEVIDSTTLTPEFEAHLEETEKMKESIIDMKKKAGLLSVLLVFGLMCFGFGSPINAASYGQGTSANTPEYKSNLSLLPSLPQAEQLQLLKDIIKAQDEVIIRQDEEKKEFQLRLVTVGNKMEELSSKIDNLTVAKKGSKFQTFLKYTTLLFPPIFTILK